MRPRSILLAALVSVTATLAACGGGEVVVRVMTEGPEGEAQPVENVVVDFLPYDRDSIFAALTERAPRGEPEVPQDLQDQYDQVLEAQQTWRDLEDRWSTARENLRNIRNRMDGLDERSREYLELFERFNEVEAQVNGLDGQRQRAFQRFDSLQKATIERSDSMQAVIRAWEDVAFADYMDITDSILRAKDVEIRTDTTDAGGYASAFGLSGDTWWVHTRFTSGPFEELYWNVPLEPSTTDTLVLERGNAEVRRSF